MISANRMGMKALPKITTTKSLVSSLFVVALIACCPIQTRADTIALSFTPSDGTFFGGAGSLTLGWGFSLSSALDVTQLGVWDQNGNGLAQSHMVTIWNSTGTAVAQVMIPSGTGAETNGFRYVSIGSVPLAAGNYTIGALYGAFGSDTASTGALAISTAAGVTYAGSRATVGNAFPGSDDFGLPNSYFGPNFQFTPTGTVPDAGSTVSLLGCALLGLAALRRKLNR